jgi:hypothetical protein
MYVYIILISHCSLYPQEKQLFHLLDIATMVTHWEVMRLCVDRSDDGNDSASTDDSGDGNDVDLFSNIAVDEESDYGIDTYESLHQVAGVWCA